MANVMDRVVVGIDNGVNSVREGSRTVVEKARLKNRMREIEVDRNRAMMNLGKWVYRMHTEHGADIPQCLERCGNIDRINERIYELKAEAEMIDAQRRASSRSDDAYRDEERSFDRRPRRKSGSRVLGWIKIALVAALTILVLMCLGCFFGNIFNVKPVFDLAGKGYAGYGWLAYCTTGAVTVFTSFACLAIVAVSGKSPAGRIFAGSILFAEGIALNILGSAFRESALIYEMPMVLNKAFASYSGITGMAMFLAAAIIVTSVVPEILKRV